MYVSRLIETLERDPARPVLHWPGSALTAGGLDRRIGRSAAALAAAGVGPGGVVGILTEPNQALAAIAEHRVTDVYLAVPHLYRLLDSPGRAGTDLSSLRQVLYTGTSASPDRLAQAAGVFGATLTQLYGSTEAGGSCALTPLDHQEPELRASVGRPFSWVGIEIRRPDGEPVARGEVGELRVRSDTLMTGYVGGPAVPPGGWLDTGDLAFQDPYGYFHLVGRTADVIKTNGLHVHLAEIERALLGHPLVADAAVFGVRDRDYADHAHAAVELRAPCTVDELRAHVAAELSADHVPAAITLWPELPLTSSGKPDQVRLRQAAHP